jgi:hypothetical protein
MPFLKPSELSSSTYEMALFIGPINSQENSVNEKNHDDCAHDFSGNRGPWFL